MKPTMQLRLIERKWDDEDTLTLLKPYSGPDFGRGLVLQQWWEADEGGEAGEWRDVQLGA